jgi:hypothetical protein
MLCGDPSQQGGITHLDDLTDREAYLAGYDPSAVSPIATPDNIVLDEVGNLWASTDGQPSSPFFGQNRRCVCRTYGRPRPRLGPPVPERYSRR